MVPLVCSQQQKSPLRSQVPEKPPMDDLSPRSPCSSPPHLLLSPILLQPGAVCSLAGDGGFLLCSQQRNTSPLLRSPTTEPSRNHPSFQQPCSPAWLRQADPAGMGGATGAVSFLPVWSTQRHSYSPLGPICGFTWLRPECCVESGSTCRGVQAEHHFSVGVLCSPRGPFWKMGVHVSHPSSSCEANTSQPKDTPHKSLSSPPPAFHPFLLPSVGTSAPNSGWTFALAQIQLSPGNTLSHRVRKAGQVPGWAKG